MILQNLYSFLPAVDISIRTGRYSLSPGVVRAVNTDDLLPNTLKSPDLLPEAAEDSVCVCVTERIEDWEKKKKSQAKEGEGGCELHWENVNNCFSLQGVVWEKENDAFINVGSVRL